MPGFSMHTSFVGAGLTYPSHSIESVLRSRIDDLAGPRLQHAGPVEVTRLPGMARILVISEGTRVAARIRNRHYDRLPELAIIGPSSRPVVMRIEGPAPLEIPLSPLDWSRLTSVVAAMTADRIVRARDLGITCLNGLANTTRGDIAATAIARLADAVVTRDAALADSSAAPLIVQLMALIDEGGVYDAATAAERLATTSHNLRRIALRWFGFPPKTLLMRRRFIAALERFQETEMDFAAIAPFGYFDASHFLRDANRFLGTTPRRYLRRIAGSADSDTRARPRR